MNELSLTTNERKTKSVYTKKDALGNVIQTRTVWNEYPIGSVVSVKTEIDTRREWLNKICNMASPSFNFTHPITGAVINRGSKREEGLKQWLNLGWTERQLAPVLDCWTEGRFIDWLLCTFDNNPISRVVKEIALWTDIETALQKDDVGTEPNGLKYLCDIFPWNPYTRKDKFIVINEDEDPQTVKTYAELSEENQEVRPGEFEVVMKPSRVVDWVNNLELSPDSITQIANREIEVHPRFDKLVERTKAVEPIVVKDIRVIER